MHITWPTWMRAAKRRLLPPRPGRISEGPGCGLRFDPGAGNPAYASGANELPVQEELARLLRTGDVVVDIGANVGFLSVIAAKLVGPRGRVIAFEPVPANARRIRRNARLNRLEWIEVVEAAVGDRTGTATLVLAGFAGGAALADADLPPDACGELEVRLTTLDDWRARSGARRPALVKVDVEGAELAVLRGMAVTLEQVRPVLLIELDDATTGGAEAKAAACEAFCTERGYHVRRLPDSYPGIAWHVIHLLATARENGSAPEARA